MQEPVKKEIDYSGIFVWSIAILVTGSLLFTIAKGVMTEKDKDYLTQSITRLEVVRNVLPWVERADTYARLFFDRNSHVLASNIIGTIHPTGKHSIINEVRTKKLKDAILIEVHLQWKGGFLGDTYNTIVVWKASEESHLYADVVSDSSIIAANSRGKEHLNAYFETQVYPEVYALTTGD